MFGGRGRSAASGWLIGLKVPLDLTRADLESLDLCHISLRNVSLSYSKLSHVHLHDADLRDADWTGAKLFDVRGHRAKFNGSDFQRAVLTQCDMSEARFLHTKISPAEFHSCTLLRCNLRWAELSGTVFDNSTLRGSQLHLAQLSGLKLSEANLSNLKGLFGPNRAFTRGAGIEDHHTESARFHRPWIVCNDARGMGGWVVDILERHAANWEFLRAIGQLRLFGVSYLAVIAITSYTLLARWHNTRVVSSAHTAADRARQTGEDDMWATLLGSLPHLPTPAHLGIQLAATASLAIAATIYALRCPNEVREATEVGWTRRMGQPLWEYRSAKWSRAWARYLCLVFFLAGGSYTLWYLFTRSWSAVVYLLQGLWSG